MTQGQRALIIGTGVAMLVEIAGIAILVGGFNQPGLGVALLVVGVIIDLIAIARWRSLGG